MARFDEHLDEAIEYVGLGKSAATDEIWESEIVLKKWLSW